MQAKAIKDAIPVSSTWEIEGENGFNTPCIDYDAWCVLPSVVAFAGERYCKTGWNSDTGMACYKAGLPIAKKE